jgi:hypothetical protein
VIEDACSLHTATMHSDSDCEITLEVCWKRSAPSSTALKPSRLAPTTEVGKQEKKKRGTERTTETDEKRRRVGERAARRAIDAAATRHGVVLLQGPPLVAR